jgi:hypothetical protein
MCDNRTFEILGLYGDRACDMVNLVERTAMLQKFFDFAVFLLNPNNKHHMQNTGIRDHQKISVVVCQRQVQMLSQRSQVQRTLSVVDVAFQNKFIESELNNPLVVPVLVVLLLEALSVV